MLNREALTPTRPIPIIVRVIMVFSLLMAGYQIGRYEQLAASRAQTTFVHDSVLSGSTVRGLSGTGSSGSPLTVTAGTGLSGDATSGELTVNAGFNLAADISPNPFHGVIRAWGGMSMATFTGPAEATGITDGAEGRLLMISSGLYSVRLLAESNEVPEDERFAKDFVIPPRTTAHAYYSKKRWHVARNP